MSRIWTGPSRSDYSDADALARAHHRAVANGTEFRLVSIADAVRRVLRLSGLDPLVPAYPDLDGAITAGADRPEADGGPGPAEIGE